MIRLAKHEDVNNIIEITKACAKHMINNSIYQWNDHYPTISAFKKDVDRQELFVLENGKSIVGCIVISTLIDKEYLPVKWLTKNKNNIYIHRLAIHPEFQGKGLAQKLMNFAEKYAKKNNFSSIRLDTFSKNKKNQLFYELRGYKKLEEIYFPKQSEFPFYCYELVL